MIGRRTLAFVPTSAVMLAVAVATAQPRAQALGPNPPPPPLEDDPAHEPYLLQLGPRGHWDRAEELLRLARTMERSGKRDRAARYYAVGCFERSSALFDATNSALECKRALELGKDLPDVAVAIAYAHGNEQAWHLDIPGAVATLQGGLAAGKALDITSELGFPLRQLRFTLGAIVLEGGKYDLALAELQTVATASAAAHDVIMGPWVDTWMCRLRTRLGEYAAAREHCAKARAGATAIDDVAMLVTLDWIESELADATGHYDAALAVLTAGWPLALLRGHEVIVPTYLLSLVGENVRLGHRDDAARWQAMLETIPLPATYAPQTALMRARIAADAADLRGAATAYEAALPSPMHAVAITARYELAATRKQLGDIAGARAALEDAIVRIETDRAAVGPDQRASFMALHALAYRELIGLVWDERGAAGADRALELAEAGRARALLDAVAMSEATGAVAATRTPAQIAAGLAPDQLVIEYAVTPTRSFAIAVTRAGTLLVPLPAAGGETILAARVSFVRQLVGEATDEAELRAGTRSLFDDVVAPVLAALPDRGAGITTVVISPDGPLHALPWDALATDAGLVIDRYAVAVVPSMSVLAGRTPSAPVAGPLVVALPEALAGYGPLVGATAEAAAVKRRVAGDVTTLVGSAATEAAIAKAAPAAAVIHFASHAAVDLAMPLRSALIVTAADRDDGRWRAEEIYRLHLAADLVVLSACETALGAPTSGEGALSLARAFLHAGAGATISTLWPVADAIGPAFTDALYRELASGHSVIASATAAKRELRAAGARPVEWAAYVATAAPAAGVRVRAGDLSAPAERRARWPWLVALAAIALVLTAVARKRAALAAGVLAVGGAAIAIVVLAGARRTDAPRELVAIQRGADAARVDARLDGGKLVAPVAAGVELRATFFAADGRAIAPPGPISTAVPANAAWALVEAVRDNAPAARPAIVRIVR